MSEREHFIRLWIMAIIAAIGLMTIQFRVIPQIWERLTALEQRIEKLEKK